MVGNSNEDKHYQVLRETDCMPYILNTAVIKLFDYCLEILPEVDENIAGCHRSGEQKCSPFFTFSQGEKCLLLSGLNAVQINNISWTMQRLKYSSEQV